mgnify:CR=1 FL=1
MLFRSFFLEYCIEIKNLNLKVSWKEQPFYRKLILVLIFIIAMIGIPFIIIKDGNYYNYFLFLGLILILIGVGWDFTSHGQKELLTIIKKHSSQRIEVLLKLLEKYSLSKFKISNTSSLTAYLYEIIYLPLFSKSLCACESLTYSGLKLKQSEISPLSYFCFPITHAFFEMQLFKQAGVISKFLFSKILSL